MGGIAALFCSKALLPFIRGDGGGLACGMRPYERGVVMNEVTGNSCIDLAELQSADWGS